MLTSLPSLPPLNAHELYFPSLSSAAPPPPTQNQHASHVRDATARPPAGTAVPHRSAHSALRADENAIATRKANIRRFGAGWLRPPGVGKTLQGMDDERHEREEQELAQQREHALQEAQAQAEAQLAAQQPAPEEYEDGDVDPNEVDLDAEIPDASSDADLDAATEDDLDQDLDLDLSATGDGAWVDEVDGAAVPPAEDEGEGDYAIEGGDESMARDLDDDVPEAGSYQHTDTEVEDTSSEDEEGWPPQRQVPMPPLMAAAAARQSLGSSIFGSSPLPEARPGPGLGRGRGRRSGGSGM